MYLDLSRLTKENRDSVIYMVRDHLLKLDRPPAVHLDKKFNKFCYMLDIQETLLERVRKAKVKRQQK